MKKVSVVTINLNQPAVTEDLLISINELNTYPNLEIIVVDNGSTINPIPAWSVKYPDVIFIRSEINKGFSGGNNLGLKIATGDYYFVVNNDTEVTPDLIGKLVDVLDNDSSIGMVSPKIMYFDNKLMVQYAGYTAMDYYTCRNECIGKGETDNGQFDHISAETSYCHGAAMLLRRDAVEKAGMLNEDLFIYYEELDWCERIKKAGFKAWIYTDALIYHKESITVGKQSKLKTYLMNRNRMIFIRLHAPFFKKIFFYLYFVLLVVPRNVITLIREKNYSFISYLLRAVWWNFTHSKTSNYLGFTFDK